MSVSWYCPRGLARKELAVQALILDDNVDDCTKLVHQLRRGGYDPVVVASIRQAREALERQLFELLLLELRLPDGDGLQLCNELRERLGDSMVIIFVTNRDEPAKRVVGLELGADDFMSKPCNDDELLIRIEARMRRRKPPVNGPSVP